MCFNVMSVLCMPPLALVADIGLDDFWIDDAIESVLADKPMERGGLER